MIICTIFYQDLIGLKRLVESCNIDMVFVDGRFLGWDGEKLSTDGSREYLKSKGKRVIDAPDLMEYQKRNIYLWYAEKMGYDYVLVIDSDEYVIKIGDLDLKNDSYKTQMLQDESICYPPNKFFRSSARHKDNHRQVYLDKKELFREDLDMINILTYHDPSHRTQMRQEYKRKYYQDNPIR